MTATAVGELDGIPLAALFRDAYQMALEHESLSLDEKNQKKLLIWLDECRTSTSRPRPQASADPRKARPSPRPVCPPQDKKLI